MRSHFCLLLAVLVAGCSTQSVSTIQPVEPITPVNVQSIEPGSTLQTPDEDAQVWLTLSGFVEPYSGSWVHSDSHAETHRNWALIYPAEGDRPASIIGHAQLHGGMLTLSTTVGESYVPCNQSWSSINITFPHGDGTATIRAQ